MRTFLKVIQVISMSVAAFSSFMLIRENLGFMWAASIMLMAILVTALIACIVVKSTK